MAIAVPLIMGAMGAGTMATALTTIAFAVTGVSAKINEAASSVFGKDLVGVANMFGTVMGATGNMPGAEGEFGATSTDPTAGNYANAMDTASDAVTNASQFGPLARMNDYANNATDAGNAYGNDTASQAQAIDQMGGPNAGADFNTATADIQQPPATNVFDRIDPSDPRAIANTTGQTTNVLPATGAASAQAAGTDAAAAQATQSGPQAIGAPSAPPAPTAPTAAYGVPGAPGPGSTAAGAPAVSPPQPSFLQRLGMTDGKGNLTQGGLRIGASVIGGAGQGYTQAQKLAEEKRQFDARMATMNQKTGITVRR